MTDDADANLVAAALRGDAESFSRLCERHYPALVAIAYSRLAERHLAQDAAQETLLAAYRDNTNLAMNRPIASSVELPGYPASRAVDADLRTSWRLGDLPQWLEVDLGDVYRVCRTQVVGANQACRFRVEVKARAEDAYVQVVDRTSNSTPGTAMEPVVDTFEPTAARYVRLTVTGTDGRRNPDIVEFRISAATQTPAAAK